MGKKEEGPTTGGERDKASSSPIGGSAEGEANEAQVQRLEQARPHLLPRRVHREVHPVEAEAERKATIISNPLRVFQCKV